MFSIKFSIIFLNTLILFILNHDNIFTIFPNPPTLTKYLFLKLNMFILYYFHYYVYKYIDSFILEHENVLMVNIQFLKSFQSGKYVIINIHFFS